MKDKKYDILQVIKCHEQDVRTVSGYPGGCILTGSRDNSAKLYQPEDPKNIHSELMEAQNFVGATNFVSSICYGKNKTGETEIYVGSHDMNIYVYTMMESKPVDTLLRHSGAVSALAFRICNEEDILVSGGWDSTVVVWKDRKPELTLIGHQYAIWDVAFVARSFVLTAGADKSIKKWDLKDGSFLWNYGGHTDCVRGLAVINGIEFLSCSNDMTIILWHIEGQILKTFTGHEEFIYSVCILREPLKPNATPPKNRPYLFASVGEDKTVKIWDKEDGCIQSIPLQARSLWSVAHIDNGNFVVGTSTGHAYIFSNVQPDNPQVE